MPNLTAQHKSKEADFGVTFRKWLKTNSMPASAFELKHTRGKDSFPFNELKDEQIAYALQAKTGVLVRVIGSNGEPDYIYLKDTPAYVVIKYPDFFCFIDIDTFLKEKETSLRKSLTSSRARDICSLAV